MIFKEEQRFPSAIIWFLVGMTIFLTLIGYQQGIFDISEGIEGDTLIYCSILLLMLGIIALFFNLKLVTQVDFQGIHYQFKPFQFKRKCVKWGDIESCTIRTYRPIGEYGGWGIRYGLKGKALTTKGNKGLQITFKKGRPLLIGTQKPEELKHFITLIEVN